MADIQHFLAKPGKVIYQLEQQMADLDKGDQIAGDIAEFERKLRQLESASALALRQLTRGVIEEAQFDKEIESIKRDRVTLEKRLAELRKLSMDQDAAPTLSSRLNRCSNNYATLVGALTFEAKRSIVQVWSRALS